MSRLTAALTSALTAIALLAGLSACTPVGMVVGASATAGSMAMEERGFETSVEDRAIALGINKRLAESDVDLFKNVSVEVVEGRVLLTGIVAKEEERGKATRLAWQSDGVREVINEIEVGNEAELTDRGEDQWVRAKISSRLVFDSDIMAVNYEVEVVNGTVYLFGIAQNPEELSRVEAHVRDTPSVRRIVSHVVMKDDPDRLAYLRKKNRDGEEGGLTGDEATGSDTTESSATGTRATKAEGNGTPEGTAPNG